jgi:hypothetical protein
LRGDSRENKIKGKGKEMYLEIEDLVLTAGVVKPPCSKYDGFKLSESSNL